jgi:dTDP-4-amino-4,6-dideoxy-D-galactose acyltransferase
MTVKTLPWDSAFFDLKIGILQMSDYNQPAFEVERDKFDLIYIFDDLEGFKDVSLIINGAIKVDEKVTYKLNINKDSEMDEMVSLFTESKPNDQLVLLSLQSGIYSRFKTDRNFPTGSFERLYTAWINQSCSKETAFGVLVYGDKNNPDGFVTLTVKGDAAYIGLIAVDECCRGKGIGKKLIQAAAHMAGLSNFTELKVVTQSFNKEACMLYEKCGFVQESKVEIYHYWTKKDASTF